MMEMALVLLIVSLLLGLSSVIWPPIQKQYAERQFFDQFEALYHDTLTRAMFSNHSGQVMINRRFVIFTVNQQTYRKTLTLPETLYRKRSKPVIITISDTSMVKPTQVIFDSKQTHKRYTYTFQMGWGRIHVKTS